MAVVRFTRFTADPDEVEQLLARRAELIAAIRESFTGLTETRLARFDDSTWIDVWRWESVAALEAAVRGAPEVPEVAAAFALTADAAGEQAEIVDER